MDTVRMIAGDKVANHCYAGHRLTPGQEFDCESQHVPTMEHLGHRRKHAAVANHYQTRELVAARSETRDAAPLQSTRARRARG